jgi:hypothetical protein
MALDLITDNWILQSVGSMLSKGLSPNRLKTLQIDGKRSHSFIEVPYAAVQIESLFTLLTNIVLRDRMLVDNRYMHIWEDDSHHFLPLLNQGHLGWQDFMPRSKEMTAPRHMMIQRLCPTPDLKKLYEQNQDTLERTGEYENDLLSSLIWGTAAMLSRSHVYEAPYSPHPLRQLVIEQTIGAGHVRDITSEVMEDLQDKRLRYYAAGRGTTKMQRASIVLPPISVDVIENSTSREDLLQRAIGFRTWHADKRTWLGMIEANMAEGHQATKELKQALEATESVVLQTMGKGPKTSMSLNVDLSLTGIGFKLNVPTMGGLPKPFRTHTMLTNMVFTKQGEDTLDKLLGMFEEKHTIIGESVREHFRNKYVS